MIVSDESFVMFMGGIPAHYACMKKDDEERQLEVEPKTENLI